MSNDPCCHERSALLRRRLHFGLAVAGKASEEPGGGVIDAGVSETSECFGPSIQIASVANRRECRYQHAGTHRGRVFSFSYILSVRVVSKDIISRASGQDQLRLTGREVATLENQHLYLPAI